MLCAGIDIGSRTSKAVVLTEEGIKGYSLIRTTPQTEKVALSKRYVGAVSLAGRYPVEMRARMLVELCKAYGVEGAIFKTERYCDPYLYELPFMMDTFKAQGFPVLSLDFEDFKAEEGRVRENVGKY